jgi:hypothetical protein
MQHLPKKKWNVHALVDTLKMLVREKVTLVSFGQKSKAIITLHVHKHYTQYGKKELQTEGNRVNFESRHQISIDSLCIHWSIIMIYDSLVVP